MFIKRIAAVVLSLLFVSIFICSCSNNNPNELNNTIQRNIMYGTWGCTVKNAVNDDGKYFDVEYKLNINEDETFVLEDHIIDKNRPIHQHAGTVKFLDEEKCILQITRFWNIYSEDDIEKSKSSGTVDCVIKDKDTLYIIYKYNATMNKVPIIKLKRM